MTKSVSAIILLLLLNVSTSYAISQKDFNIKIDSLISYYKNEKIKLKENKIILQKLRTIVQNKLTELNYSKYINKYNIKEINSTLLHQDYLNKSKKRNSYQLKHIYGDDVNVVQIKLKNGKKASVIKYIVKRGDTLRKITTKTYKENSNVSWKNIKKRISIIVSMNDQITLKGYIYPNQIIYLPFFKQIKVF